MKHINNYEKVTGSMSYCYIVGSMDSINDSELLNFVKKIIDIISTNEGKDEDFIKTIEKK